MQQNLARYQSTFYLLKVYQYISKTGSVLAFAYCTNFFLLYNSVSHNKFKEIILIITNILFVILYILDFLIFLKLQQFCFFLIVFKLLCLRQAAMKCLLLWCWASQEAVSPDAVNASAVLWVCSLAEAFKQRMDILAG